MAELNNLKGPSPKDVKEKAGRPKRKKTFHTDSLSIEEPKRSQQGDTLDQLSAFLSAILDGKLISSLENPAYHSHQAASIEYSRVILSTLQQVKRISLALDSCVSQDINTVDEFVRLSSKDIERMQDTSCYEQVSETPIWKESVSPSNQSLLGDLALMFGEVAGAKDFEATFMQDMVDGFSDELEQIRQKDANMTEAKLAMLAQNLRTGSLFFTYSQKALYSNIRQ